MLSTQVARPLVEIFFGRLDARTVSGRTTAELVERYFPGGYDLVAARRRSRPARSGLVAWRGRSAAGDDSGRCGSSSACARSAAHCGYSFARCGGSPADARWEAVVWTDVEPEPLLRLSKRLRERVRTARPADASPEQLLAAADVACLASGGPQPSPGLLRAAIAAGAVPVASHLDVYEELTGDGERGLLFPPGDPITLAGQLERLIAEPSLRRRLRRGLGAAGRSWSEVSRRARGDLRRASPRGATTRPASRRSDAGSRRARSIHCDLHMHTDHSPDCATPVEVLLETARDRGLGAIAITDHNEISGALAAREVAATMDGIEVIVAEEVKTAERGRGDRALPRGADPARADDGRDDRRDQAPGRAGLRSASRSTACTPSPTTSTC